MPDEVTIREKHLLLIRWTHWINFPLLTIMMWSGLMIYWANPAYWPPFPDAFYRALSAEARLADGLAIHFFFMWFFALNGILYAVYVLMSGAWREMLPRLKTFKEAWHTVLHDLKIRKAPLPDTKFNGAQKFAYTGVLLMGFGSLLSGLAIYKPLALSGLTSALGGYESARLIHYLLTVGYVLFFFVHVLQVLRAGWNAFRAMIAGYEIVRPEDK